MWHHKLHRGGNLVKTLADIGSGASMGIAALSQDLTINGQTVSPTFRYEAKNATTGLWTATVGENLTGAGSGGTVGLDTPLLTDDEAVNGDTTRYWEASTTSFADIDEEDFVIEAVFKCQSTTNGRIFSKYFPGGGYTIYKNATTLSLFLDGVANATISTTSSILVGAWFHAIVFVDKSGSAIFYVNGETNGVATSVATVGSISQASHALRANADPSGGSIGDSGIVYAAMWKRDNWLDTHLQASVAAERFAKLNGTWSDALSKGPDQSLLRNSVATLEKQGQSGAQKLFLVGARWPRIEKRPDKYGRYAIGCNSEGQHTNLQVYSEDFSNVAWTKAGSSITSNSRNSPFGEQVADTLVEDASAASLHQVYDSFTQSAGQVYTFQCFVRPANRQWCLLRLFSATDGEAYAYFNTADGVVGENSALDSYGIRYVGDGWFFCWIADTRATAEAAFDQIMIAESDGVRTFNGASQDSLYLFGAQVTATNKPVSYVKTEAATATRLSDRLLYSGITLPSKGSIACDVLFDGDIVSNAFIGTLSDGGSADNRVAAFLSDASGTDSGRSFVRTGAVTQADVTGTTAVDDRVWNEIRTPFAADDVRVLINGISEGTPDTSATIPSALDRIDVGSDQAGSSQADSLVRLRLLSSATDKNVTDFGAIMAKSSAYISTPAAVAQSTSYANVGGTFTEVNSSDFTVSSAGVFTYTGTDTKRFACFAAVSGSISTGTPEVTTTWEKNGAEVASSVSKRDVGSSAIGAWGVAADIELANGDTLNLATKVDSGTPNFTAETCSVVIVEAGN